MAETERAWSALQTLLADNTVKAISPQDLRDAIVSCLGGYAGIYVDANTTAQSFIGTPAKLACFASSATSRGATPDPTNDQITVGVAGDYKVDVSLSLASALASDFDVAVFSNGVALAGFAARVHVGTDWAHISLSGVVALPTGAIIDLRLSCSPSASATVRAAHLSVKRIG